MVQTALRHGLTTEAVLMAEGRDLGTICLTGAMILARTAYHTHRLAPQGTIQPYRELAHAILDEALGEIELMMGECEGRA